MASNHQNSSNFIELIQNNSFNIIDAIFNHPYLYALEKKEIPKEKLEIFVCEQYHIISNDRRNFAFMISKASCDVASKLFNDCLDAEVNALANLKIMADELVVDKGKIEAYEQLAGCQAYTNYLTRLSAYGSDAEVVAALLIDLPVWGANCSKMSSILKKNYDFTDNSLVFLDKFASPLPEDFVSKSKELIDSTIPQSHKSLCSAARLILDYELSFWDTIYKSSIIR